eukprot:sb/3473035/
MYPFSECTDLTDGYKVTDGAQYCSSTYQFVYSTSLVNCSLCPDDHMAAESGASCVACPTANALASGVCSCDFTTQILVDTDKDGTTVTPTACQTCTSGYKPGAEDIHGVPRQCVKCEHSDCTCDYNADTVVHFKCYQGIQLFYIRSQCQLISKGIRL